MAQVRQAEIQGKLKRDGRRSKDKGVLEAGGKSDFDYASATFRMEGQARAKMMFPPDWVGEEFKRVAYAPRNNSEGSMLLDDQVPPVSWISDVSWSSRPTLLHYYVHLSPRGRKICY